MVVLFVVVLVFFALAQEDTKKIERMYQNTSSSSTFSLDIAPRTGAAIKAQERTNGLSEVQAR